MHPQEVEALVDVDDLRLLLGEPKPHGEKHRCRLLYLKAGDEVGRARTRIGFAGTCTYTGQVREALAGADRARDILAAHQLWVRLARLESVVGLLLRELGRTPEALVSYERALAAAASDIRAQLLACQQRIEVVLEQLRLVGSSDLERIALLQGQQYSPAPYLDDKTVLLEFFALGNDLVAFVVTSDAVRATTVERGVLRADSLHLTLWLNLAAAATVFAERDRLRQLEPNVKAVLRRLYDVLIGPVHRWIGKHSRLVVVPHGGLHDVPFAALYDGSRYLLESYEVTIAPSAGTVAMCRRPRGRLTLRSLVAAHSDRGRFPWVIDEAHTVADFFPGEVFLEEEATLAAVREGAVTADVIHVAAHGVSRVDAPLFSNVRLADGEFTALDWLDLELDCVLVTLSACESGIGTVTPGDEPVGLSRSLLYAGARSVLQTLWRVDDQATSTLMRAFYRRLRDGRGRGEALQLAQLELLQASAASGTTHPFFWAAFALVGDWRPLLSDSPHVQKGEQRAVIQHI